MWISELRVEQLRCVERAELALPRGLIRLIGANGAGKTSLLEAIAILGSGRSFRGGPKTPLVRDGQEELQIYARVEAEKDENLLGFSRSKNKWQARGNGSEITSLGELVRKLPVLVIEPNSHELISGPSEARRRLFDWLLFHVEPNFSAISARYRRVLAQRNAALKQDPPDFGVLAAYSEQLSAVGEELAELRARGWVELSSLLVETLGEVLPELGRVDLEFSQGWEQGETLLMALEQRLDLDCIRGHTSRGPHRADWSLSFQRAKERAWLSRGQEKNAFIAYSLAVLRRFKAIRGESAVLCIDDLFSELDAEHQARCIAQAEKTVDQLWISGTFDAPSADAWKGGQALFHVEQGRVHFKGPY